MIVTACALFAQVISSQMMPELAVLDQSVQIDMFLLFQANAHHAEIIKLLKIIDVSELLAHNRIKFLQF